ncbi:hypothetical protein TEA_002199 [Camellia sinensis var. sinensis]|uniref:Uncharacterized protein n=1 Tax=Camellia sinensis var. sinensis TaxID=542762 RepID=A0A4S4DXU5_CAMSN|nr:hypothetical protein TEA_002199 [Camellia sinensis var. sinensis]
MRLNSEWGSRRAIILGNSCCFSTTSGPTEKVSRDSYDQEQQNHRQRYHNIAHNLLSLRLHSQAHKKGEVTEVIWRPSTAKTSDEACQSRSVPKYTYAASKKTREPCQNRTVEAYIYGINKVCAKFRKKTLEHRDLMDTVFTGASATAQPFADPIPARVQDMDSDSSLEPVPTEKGKRRKTPSTSVSKSKKATSGATVIAESMNNLTNVARTQNQQVTVSHLTDNESLYTISECMHHLTNIPSLIGTPLFHFASTLMDNADYREVMMCQPNNNHIIGWLT